MRNVVWLAGWVLVVSCTVNSSNLNVDASSTGTGGRIVLGTGGTIATGGTTGSGGEIVTGGTTGTGGVIATGGTTGGGGVGGDSCPRCAPTGGTTGTGGTIATGGTTGTGGITATGGTIGTGGITATGGTTGTGGQAGAGGGSGRTCAQLETAYSNALTAAKSCTPGTQNQCKQLADSSISCPGCSVYVNDTTELDALKAEWISSGCALKPQPCPAIACVMPSFATCTPNNSGPGSGSSGTCTSK